MCLRAGVRACAPGTRVTSHGKRKQVADGKQTVAGEFFATACYFLESVCLCVCVFSVLFI